jgi:hypothetical protein
VTTNAVVVTPPGAFTLSATATSKSTIALSWTASSGATSYQVFRRKGTKGAFTLDSGCTSTGTRSCSDGGLAAGTQYYYYVLATNTGGSTPSNTATAKTPRR